MLAVSATEYSSHTQLSQARSAGWNVKTGVKVGLAAIAAALIVGGYMVSTRVEPEAESASRRTHAAPPVDAVPAPARVENIPVPEVTKENQPLPETHAVLIAPPPENATSSK